MKIKFACILALLWATSAFAQTPTYKQQCLQDAQNPTCTMPGTTAAHDTYVVILGLNNNSTESTPTDTEGNTFVLKIGPTVTAGGEVAQYVWVVQDAIGGSTDAFSQVTGDTSSFLVLDLSSSSYFDTHSAQQAQPTGVVASPSFTSQVATEIIFGLGSTKTSGNGFSSYDATNFANHIGLGTQVAEYDNDTTLQTGLVARATTGAGTPAVMAIVGFANAPPAGTGSASKRGKIGKLLDVF